MIVRVEGLSYSYPGGVGRVLDELDFEIREGEIFGFLGPNGSGKTTTQKLLTRILFDYEGRLEVLGQDLTQYGSELYNHIGVCFEFPNLYDKLTAEENLQFYRGFFDVPTEEPREWLERLDLPVGDPRKVGQFSKGMKMRLALTRSLLNRPRLWFLDEPTAGQDPLHAVQIRRLIRERADGGTTVFLTTHNMAVADELCDRVALLIEGRIAVIDAPRDLKLRYSRKRARMEYRNDDGLQTVELSLEDPEEKRAFLELVRDHAVETIHTQEPSLEDVFLEVTGRGLE